MHRLKISVVGLCETRWNTFRQMTTATGDTFLYSGREREEDEHSRGVGILIAKDAAKSLMEWEPVSERIMTARFYTKGRNITLIQCYAPTNKADLEDKDNFYQQLQAVLSKLPKRDIKIMLGGHERKSRRRQYKL